MRLKYGCDVFFFSAFLAWYVGKMGEIQGPSSGAGKKRLERSVDAHVNSDADADAGFGYGSGNSGDDCARWLSLMVMLSLLSPLSLGVGTGSR